MFNNYEKQTFYNVTGSNYGSIHVVDCSFTKIEQSNLELFDSMIFESKWEYCNFSDALISKNKFGYSSFSQCNICDSKLIKNEFQDISFNTVRFSDSSICGSDFENCEFYRTAFENVDFANSVKPVCVYLVVRISASFFELLFCFKSGMGVFLCPFLRHGSAALPNIRKPSF